MFPLLRKYVIKCAYCIPVKGGACQTELYYVNNYMLLYFAHEVKNIYNSILLKGHFKKRNSEE